MFAFLATFTHCVVATARARRVTVCLFFALVYVTALGSTPASGQATQTFCISGQSDGVGWSWGIVMGGGLVCSIKFEGPLPRGASCEEFARQFVGSIKHTCSRCKAYLEPEKCCFTVVCDGPFEFWLGDYGGDPSSGKKVTGSPDPVPFNPLIFQVPVMPTVGITNRATRDLIIQTARFNFRYRAWGWVTLSIIDPSSYFIEDGSLLPVKVVDAGHPYIGGEFAIADGFLSTEGTLLTAAAGCTPCSKSNDVAADPVSSTQPATVTLYTPGDPKCMGQGIIEVSAAGAETAGDLKCAGECPDKTRCKVQSSTDSHGGKREWCGCVGEPEPQNECRVVKITPQSGGGPAYFTCAGPCPQPQDDCKLVRRVVERYDNGAPKKIAVSCECLER